jgi:predicted PurR-regulated permease PerM
MNTSTMLVLLFVALVVIGFILAGSMDIGALVFMLFAWAVVLGILVWSFARLLRSDPKHEQLPPPGSIP